MKYWSKVKEVLLYTAMQPMPAVLPYFFCLCLLLFSFSMFMSFVSFLYPIACRVQPEISLSVPSLRITPFAQYTQTMDTLLEYLLTPNNIS